MAKLKAAKAELAVFQNHENPHVRNRATIILLTLEKKSVDEISAAVGVSAATIKKWQSAWADQGMAIFPEESKSDSEEIQPVKPPLQIPHPQPIQPDDSMAQAGAKIMLAQLAELIKHEPIARAGEDIEGVHKMRVATRRLRSANRIFADQHPMKKKLLKDLKYTAQVLGEVRDLDMFLYKTLHYLAVELKGNADPLEPLLSVIRQRHDKARAALIEWLDDDQFHRFLERFQNYLAADEWEGSVERRVDHVLPGMIYKCLEAVRHYETLLEGASIETLHSLRIEFKRLRYILEFFEPVLGKSVDKVIDSIKKLQDHLGDLNDARVAVELVELILKRVPEDQAEGLIAYRDTRLKEIDDLLETFPAEWDQFNSHMIREALALAVGKL